VTKRDQLGGRRGFGDGRSGADDKERGDSEGAGAAQALALRDGGSVERTAIGVVEAAEGLEVRDTGVGVVAGPVEQGAIGHGHAQRSRQKQQAQKERSRAG
jgi:hypothetical protein